MHSPPARARVLACDALLFIDKGVRASRAVLHDELDRLPDQRDRALVQQIVLGVLRYRLQLDWQIDSFLPRPERLDARARMILRIGLFQAWYCDRIPDHAIVNEAVEMTKRQVEGRAHKLVNAVMRKLLKVSRDDALARLDPDKDEDLAIISSHPLWLIRRWRSSLPPDRLRRILLVNNDIPPHFIRDSPFLRAEDNEYSTLEPVSGIPTARLSPFHPSHDQDDADRESEHIFQDAHSQWATMQLDVRPGDRVFDVFAGRGGKTFCMVDLWAKDPDWARSVSITAADRHMERLSDMNKTAALYRERGLQTRLECLAWNFLESMPRADGKFDRVLLDVPCTNLGVIRRHPEIRWRVSEREIGESQIRQRRFMRMTSSLVSPGGYLLYSVCTTEPEEGVEVVRNFLENHRDFRPQPLPTPEYVGCDAEVTDEGFVTLYPSARGGDGFFVAKLQRVP